MSNEKGHKISPLSTAKKRF